MLQPLLLPLVVTLGWQNVTVVTEDLQTAKDLLGFNDLWTHQITHVIVSDSHNATSGQWVNQLVKTGDISWTPQYIAILCSEACAANSLKQADSLVEELGTLSAFNFASQWLVVPLPPSHAGQIVTSAAATRTLINIAIVNISLSNQTGKLAICKDSHHPVFTLTRHPHGNVMEKVGKILTSGKPQLTSDLFRNVQHGFSEKHLRIITKEWTSYVKSKTINETKVWSGLLIDLLAELSRTLNFTYTIVEPEDGGWGTGTEDDHVSGVLGHLIRKEADMGLVPVNNIWERNKVLGFSHPISFSFGALVYRLPVSRDGGHLLLIYPFDRHVLVAIVATLLVVVCMLVCFERCSGEHKQSWLTIHDRSWEAATAALFSKETCVEPTSRPGRVVWASWCLVTVVTAAAYSSTLTAALSVTREAMPISSLESLIGQSQYSWGTLPNSSFYLIFKNTNSFTYRQVWVGIQSFLQEYDSLEPLSQDVMIQRVTSRDFVAIMSGLDAVFYQAENCHIKIVDAHVGTFLTSLPFPKSSALIKPISNVILQLHANGMMAYWTAKWFPINACESRTKLRETSLTHIQGALLALSLGAGFATLVLGAEIVFKKWRRCRPQI